MDKARLFRRGVHCLIALAPLYFLLPEDLPLIGLRRWVLLIAFFVGIAAFEVYRLRKGIVVMGLRPHEKNSIASFVWAAAGITTALWLLPRDIASAALVGMAFADPGANGPLGIPLSPPLRCWCSNTGLQGWSSRSRCSAPSRLCSQKGSEYLTWMTTS